MICAHTVRKLKPGTFDQFAAAFMPEGTEPPPGIVRFTMLRGVANPDEVITFGVFDATPAQLDELQTGGYQELLERIAPYVDSVVLNGVYDVVMEETPAG